MLRPRPEIAKLDAGVHGGIDYAELKARGISPEDVLDFSVCTNPFMPPPGIKKALNRVPWDRYPDSAAGQLRERLSQKLGLGPENILVGSGTTELIRLIAQVYLERGDRALILEPTFSEYGAACGLAGAEVIRWRALPEAGFKPDIAGLARLIREHRPKVAFICNPNNPTGVYLGKETVEAVLNAGEGLLVLDEAYAGFVERRWPSAGLLAAGNLVILRSMTKDYGLAGLRLGYALARNEIIAAIRKACPPWNVNSLAQTAGLHVLESDRFLDETRRRINTLKSFLVKRIAGLGLEVLPSDTHYFLVKTPDARRLRAALLERGILVRDCASFGLPEYLRISPRPMTACRRLIAGLRHELGR